MKKHIVIFSHGFGVEKTDRGLFSDVALALSSEETILFDYNNVDETKGNVTVRPFSKQIEILREVIERTQRTNPDAVIDLVCHSQGCLIVALAKPMGIRKTIFLAPPMDVSIERTLERYRNHPKVVIDLKGVSQLSRTDGTTTFVPAEYWKERGEQGALIETYNSLSEMTELVVVKALQDTVLGETSFEGLNPQVRVIQLQSDHDFTGDARQEMVTMVKKEIEIH